MPLANQFASLFTDHRALEKLEHLGPQTALPTFNLTTTSLRHLPKWFDRLNDINQRTALAPHGNYYSDPASIGLVDASATPPILTQAGNEFLNLRTNLYRRPEEAEYNLLKILYFMGYRHNPRVQGFLTSKQEHMVSLLSQFYHSTSRPLFLQHARLLVIAELIADFPGAVSGLMALPNNTLLELNALGEEGFKNLCRGPNFPTGLERLCRRIGADYTRGAERRLYYMMGMALLTISQNIPPHRASPLVVPAPFSNLLTESDIHAYHAQYTAEISVWFDGVTFQVSSSLYIPTVPPGEITLHQIQLRQQTGTPRGRGTAPPGDPRRRRRKATQPTVTTVIIDPMISERAEDYVEHQILRPQYGNQLIRVGHCSGENYSLPDGMVPGADFYVINVDDQPTEFIEVKSTAGRPPANIALTRAEYLRACLCAQNEIPYRLILFDVMSGEVYEVGNFATEIATVGLNGVVQFIMRVR